MGKSNNGHQFYEIKAKGGKKAEILIYDQISKDWYGDGKVVEAKKFIRDLKALGNIDDLDIRMNCPGGSVQEGTAIYNALKAFKANKTVYIDALAASMGSVIAMAGDKIVIAKNALMMIHNPQSGLWGDAKSLRKWAETLDKIKEGIITAYEDRTGQSREKLAEMMDEETWMDAEEAVELGFADEVGDEVELAAGVDFSTFRNSPSFMALQSAWASLKKPETLEAPEPEATVPTPKIADNKGDATKMDLETLKKEHPELAAALAKEGSDAERKRIQDIEAIAMPGHEDLVNQFKFDGKTSGADAALAIVAAEKKNRELAHQNLKKDAPAPVPQPSTTPVENNSLDHLPLEDRCKKKWEADAELRKEFENSFDRYLKNEQMTAEGRVRAKN